jgi:ADP-ribose pyrophosphatase YjhB (NUDIX family)
VFRPRSARPLASFGAIFNATGEILLVRLSYDQGQWTMPGGNIDPGESPAEAVVREVREETGLQVTVEDVYAVYWRRDIDGIQFGFRCHVTGGVLAPDGREILEARYFSPEALPRPITTGTIARIHDARRREPVGVKIFEGMEYLR